MGQDRAVHPHDVVAFADHDAPPIILHVPLQLHPKRPVIPATIQSAIDFARLENESPPLTQADDLSIRCGSVFSLIRMKRATADYADDTDEEKDEFQSSKTSAKS